MNYTLEEIYILVGREDKVAGLSLKPGTESFEKYGAFITVLFIYTQTEREEMDALIQKEPFNKTGKIKSKYLGRDIPKDRINELLIDGINSNDISEILYLTAGKDNTFHSKEKRQIGKMSIPIHLKPKGQDLDWMYGFSKRFLKDGIGQSPYERSFYLAGKLYYEPTQITELEKVEIYCDGKIVENVEWEYLQMKFKREEITDMEKLRYSELFHLKKQNSIKKLDHYLQQAGSSLKKLSSENIGQAVKLFTKVMRFHERRLNPVGRFPIFLDLDSFLHIYMRHVEEFKVSEHFEHKDNFQWDEEDVLVVMKQVIKDINEEYQKFRDQKPTFRFSKYGSQSLYFQGDYYTFHIENDGRISTFHKNKKSS